MSRRQPQRDKTPPRLLLPSQRAKQQSAAHDLPRSRPEQAAHHNEQAERQTAHDGDDGQTSATDSHRSPATASGQATVRGHAQHFDSTERSTALPLPLGPGVSLLAWHPCGLYVLDKPEGVLSHPNKKAEISRSLLLAPYSLEHEYFYNLHAPAQKETTPADTALPDTKLYLLHRLDSATSGLLLLADNEALANSIRTAFAEGGVRKTYFALCAATTAIRAGQKGRWSDRLQREHSGSSGGVVHVKTSNSGLSAVTDFACRKTSAPAHALALLELHPLSGRTHQLRVHCAQHGLPIIGDAKYGDFRLNRAIAKDSGEKRLFLHAAALELTFTFGGKQLRLQYAAALPDAFENLLHNPPEIPRSVAARTHMQQAHGSGHRNSATGSAKGRKPQQPRGGGKRR